VQLSGCNYLHIYMSICMYYINIFLVLHARVCINIVCTLYRTSVRGSFYKPTVGFGALSYVVIFSAVMLLACNNKHLQWWGWSVSMCLSNLSLIILLRDKSMLKDVYVSINKLRIWSKRATYDTVAVLCIVSKTCLKNMEPRKILANVAYECSWFKSCIWAF